MSERKNIDRLFQEKFKDFEVNPPELVWTNIEAELDEKKKRRILPFWWKLSGVAAVFLIGFLISKSIYSTHIQNGNTVVNETNPAKTEAGNGEDSNSHLKNSNSGKTENALVNENNPDKIKQGNSEDSGTPLKNMKATQTNNSLVNENNLDKRKQKSTENSNTDRLRNKRTIQNENAIAGTNSGEIKNTLSEKEKKSRLKNKGNNKLTQAVAATFDENKSASEEKTNRKKTPSSSGSLIAERKSPRRSSLKNKSNAEKTNSSVASSLFEKSQDQMAQNTNNNKQSVDQKAIAQTTTDTKNKTSFDTKNSSLDALKGDINSKIVTQETVKKVNDTAAKNSVVSNALEELLNEKESKLKQESKGNRWQLTSNVAPIFLGSVANGSPIDSTLSKNSKSFNTNVGFGVGVSYAVNKKISVRTGINKVNMSYDTNDIVFFSAIEARSMKNITPTASSAAIQVQSALPANQSPAYETELLPFETNFAQKNTGYLKQEMGYLEMPVEMTYNLVDKKFGIKIIGGFSTLFLQDNSIYIMSEGRETVLGKANNLNDVHFSTNLGLGLKYAFLKSFEFNVEPTFKYQLNTFSDSVGNFKPYYFGVFSGVSYKF